MSRFESIRWKCWAFVIGLLVCTFAQAQLPSGLNRAYLLTIGPGNEVYELFGHNAIVLAGTDEQGRNWEVAYNWGVFDFHQPNFVGRFIQGRMLYTMQGQSVGGTIALAEEQGRWVRVRQFQMSPAQLAKLGKLITENDSDGNRDYRYDYYRDNCSTRVRDMIDRAVDGQVATALKGKPAGPGITFRFHTDRLSQKVPWLWLGLKYVLGHPVDRELDQWDESFLPMVFESRLEEVTIRAEDGTNTKLLGNTIYVSPSGVTPSPAQPPRWELWTLIGGLLWGSAIAVVSFRKGKWWRRLAALLIVGWSGLCCVAGGISTWGWFFTDHAASRNNENWLQLNPLSLPMLAIGIALLLGFRPKRAVWVAATLLGLSALGWMLKMVPGMIQPNLAILLLALPVHAGVLVGVLRLTRSST